MRWFASKSTTRASWSHRVSLCLPQAGCAMNGRTVLTALGPDIQALREEDRQATLFDLGLGALQVDVCIRVADPKVTAELLSHAGRPLFEPGNPAMSVILASSPHRVFASRLGRIEVFHTRASQTAAPGAGRVDCVNDFNELMNEGVPRFSAREQLGCRRLSAGLAASLASTNPTAAERQP